MKEDRFLRKQIQTLNRHLPKRRASLAKLLKEEKPQVTARDKTTHRFKKQELKYLAELLPKDLHKRLRLPIIIRISPQLGRGAAKISGKIERTVIEKILEKEKSEEDELVIYRPEVRIVRKKLPTTTQYAFMISTGAPT
ncbi:hypothetical protein AKJ44_01190 [candidate division MSBL1 archaeon SCGC-AAA261F17]|uniref:UPF0216 protein AKJ44_01190 n=3 Tax=candidate division MSBL1 TaxID=215777 RepID=A0A133V6U9_9EURY|nr:hypothetical protein AKJ44_01190 [candidate division MSBL1 archaeon SCGC-AAA261F17]KXB03684.1 hypothetical protein AKJ47_01840 [candidate division MSBL1 archaeon SCGC-AAA261G05]KXB04146.1 hypothetical protein AKJ48_03335 [candidate division MSBL1 archaeon SCGC-AAA261O19]